MLVPTNLRKGSKERKEYVKANTRATGKINVGPKAGLRPVGGDLKEKKK